jgi:ParB/RepB/Spo0J family partition protein
VSVKLPADFAKKIGECLGATPLAVAELFEIEEDKQGFFIAKLKPKQFLDKARFKTMCTLIRGLGGEGYLQGAKAWKVPGPCVKKTDTSTPEPAGDARSKTPERAMDRQPTYKELGNAVPTGSSGVAPRVVTDDKTRPPQTTVPIKALLSMPFQCRTNPDDPEMAELTESIKAQGVLQPILVRPKPNGLYEIVYGQRRAKAAEKAGLVEVPVSIRFLSDEEAFTLQLTENLQRKDLSEEEKARALGELAKRTGWNAQQIADKLKMSYTWVVKYLPTEFKDKEMSELGKLGAESRADSGKEQDLHVATRRVAETPCAHCGEPIQGQVYHFEGMFYDQECYEQVQAEKVPGLLPEPERAVEPEEEKEPEPPALDIGGFECPECHKHFIVEHLPNGKHKLKPVREEE